jgi:hypothetical protein
MAHGGGSSLSARTVGDHASTARHIAAAVKTGFIVLIARPLLWVAATYSGHDSSEDSRWRYRSQMLRSG